MHIQLSEKEIAACIQEKYSEYGEFKIAIRNVVKDKKKTFVADLAPYDEIEEEAAPATEEEATSLNF